MPKAVSSGVAADLLQKYVDRIERLSEEKQQIADSVAAVYAEAKASGFDTKVLRAVVRERAQNAEDVQEFYSRLDVYRHALGMLYDTPLGSAAVKKATERT